ncbi:hypothetical protein SPHINGO8AM_80052 [Sphingomonas sp. 8AM]|nr:hypothetical protein SPHINGO8AM_80052 [Sphingomonas sp. 8AM]
MQAPSLLREGLGLGYVQVVRLPYRAAGDRNTKTLPTPTRRQVNVAPHRLDHAGGMTDLSLLKREGRVGRR